MAIQRWAIPVGSIPLLIGVFCMGGVGTKLQIRDAAMDCSSILSTSGGDSSVLDLPARTRFIQ